MVAATAVAWADDDVTPKDPVPPTAVTVNVKRGDQWTYESRDVLTDERKATLNFTVSDVLPDEIDTRARLKKAGAAETTSLVIYDNFWRRKDDGVWTYKQRQDSWGIPENLAVGEKWSYQFEMSRADPPSDFNYSGDGNVLGWEHVTLRSGLAYDAFKIEFKEAMTPVVNGKERETFVTEWYAPSVNRYVQRVYETRQNSKLLDSGLEYLVDYIPGKQ